MRVELKKTRLKFRPPSLAKLNDVSPRIAIRSLRPAPFVYSKPLWSRLVATSPLRGPQPTPGYPSRGGKTVAQEFCAAINRRQGSIRSYTKTVTPRYNTKRRKSNKKKRRWPSGELSSTGPVQWLLGNLRLINLVGNSRRKTPCLTVKLTASSFDTVPER